MDNQALHVDNAYGSCPIDALKAVERDPAVIKAQIRVDPNKEKVEDTQTEQLQNVEIPKSESSKFEEMITKQKAALFSLAPEKFKLLLKYVGILRMQRSMNQKQLECAFCKNNGESESWYSNHVLKDNRNRVRCPVLRAYRCPLCGSSGDNAHTIKYCFLNNDCSST